MRIKAARPAAIQSFRFGLEGGEASPSGALVFAAGALAFAAGALVFAFAAGALAGCRAGLFPWR